MNFRKGIIYTGRLWARFVEPNRFQVDIGDLFHLMRESGKFGSIAFAVLNDGQMIALVNGHITVGEDIDLRVPDICSQQQYKQRVVPLALGHAIIDELELRPGLLNLQWAIKTFVVTGLKPMNALCVIARELLKFDRFIHEVTCYRPHSKGSQFRVGFSQIGIIHYEVVA